MENKDKLSISDHNELITKATEMVESLKPFKDVLQGLNAIKALSQAMGDISELYRLNFKPTANIETDVITNFQEKGK